MYFHSNRAQNPVHLPFLCKLLFGKAFAWWQSSHNAVVDDFFKRNHKVSTKRLEYAEMAFFQRKFSILEKCLSAVSLFLKIDQKFILNPVFQATTSFILKIIIDSFSFMGLKIAFLVDFHNTLLLAFFFQRIIAYHVLWLKSLHIDDGYFSLYALA